MLRTRARNCLLALGATLGLIVLLDAADIYAAPALYGPAGGVSGRTTFAVIIWLVAWAVLHHRWKRESSADQANQTARRVAGITVALVVFGLLATFPPLWSLF